MDTKGRVDKRSASTIGVTSVDAAPLGALSTLPEAPRGIGAEEVEIRPDLDRLAALTHAVVGELGLSLEDVRLVIDEALYQAGCLLKKEGRVALPNLGVLDREGTWRAVRP